MAPRRRRAGRNPSGVNRNMLNQRQKLTAQRLPVYQGPSPAPQQGPSLRIPQGVLGDRPPASAAARPAPGPDIWKPGSYKGGTPPMPKGSGNPLQMIRQMFGLMGGPATTAAMVMEPTAFGDGTLEAAKARGDYTTPKAPEPTVVNKPQAQRLSAAARSFDRAFAAARRQGKDVFTWRGKRYTTELAD